MIKETKAKNPKTEDLAASAPAKTKEPKVERSPKEPAREVATPEEFNGHIGKAAGLVWHYLNSNGAASASKLGEGTKLDRDSVQRAIGWLAREGKIAIERRGRHEFFALANQ
jgi:DNA-binding transcriptional ArsR family regulator